MESTLKSVSNKKLQEILLLAQWFYGPKLFHIVSAQQKCNGIFRRNRKDILLGFTLALTQFYGLQTVFTYHIQDIFDVPPPSNS